MNKSSKGIIAAVVTVAAVVGGASNAIGAAGAPSTGQKPSVTAQQLRYSDRDVVSFFLLATGPLMTSHSGLAAKLGLKYQSMPNEVIDQVAKDVLKVNPNFNSAVVAPIQSRDPVRVQAALAALTQTAQQVQAAQEDTGIGTAAIVNKLVGSNLVAAALVVVVAAAAVVGPVVAILYAPSSHQTRFEKEMMAASVVESL